MLYEQTTLRLSWDQIFSEGPSHSHNSTINHSMILPNTQSHPNKHHVNTTFAHTACHSSVRQKTNTTAHHQLHTLSALIRQKQKSPQALKKQPSPSGLPQSARRLSCNYRAIAHPPPPSASIPGPSSPPKTLQQPQVAPKEPIKSPKKTNKATKKGSLIRSKSASSVHERLFLSSRLSELRHKYLCEESPPSGVVEVEKAEKGILISANSQRYNQYLPPFQERLELQLRMRREKKKMLDRNPHFADGKVEQYFKPRLYPSQYSSRVSPRYLDPPKKHQIQVAAPVPDSLTTSFSSQIYRTETKHHIQEYFFRKMNVIFTSKQRQMVSANECSLSILSDVQFGILQQFIMGLEIQPLPRQQFDSRLKQYYYALPKRDQETLRRHLTFHKVKVQQLKNQIQKGRKLIQRQDSNPEQYGLASSMKKSSKYRESNYNGRMEVFV